MPERLGLAPVFEGLGGTMTRPPWQHADADDDAGTVVPAGVLPERTVVPDAPAGAIRRTDLLDRFDPMERRLTVLVGPAGFGKTTLLADFCRLAEERGVKSLWLSLDESDDGHAVLAHLAYAAGLDWAAEEPMDRRSRRTVSFYLDHLSAALRSDGGRWLLAADELERVSDSAASVLDYLIWRGPANLHIAFAGRELPRSIDAATPVAAGRGVVVGPEELRFTRADLGRYLEGGASRERLNEQWAESRGWPIAACLQRNVIETGSEAMSDLSLNWVATRLMRGIPEEHRRFLLEAACFERADAQLFDEVLGAGATERLRRLGALRGLVQGIDGGKTFGLHPLVRQHAENEMRLRGEGGDVRRRIARALAARGRTLEAMRQAAEAGDDVLAADILERAGAVRLVLTDGIRALQAATALLRKEAAERSPRLVLARYAASATETPGDELPLYESLLARDEGETDVRAGEDELRIDALIVCGVHLIASCAPIGSDEVRLVMRQTEGILAAGEPDPVVVGGISHGHAVYRYESGDLAGALAAVRRVREVGRSCPAIALEARILEGAILFEQGVSEESERVLAQAQADARRAFSDNLDLIGAAFVAQAALETNRIEAAERYAPSLPQLAGMGAWLGVYVAALDVRIELALRQEPPARALHIVERALDFARADRLQGLARWLSAVRVSTLVRVGRADEAERLAASAFPKVADLYRGDGTLGWREIEAVSSARVRVLLARGEWAAALTLGRSFAAWAEKRGIVRSQALAAALAMHAAWRGGDGAAAELLVESIGLCQRTGYVRALAEQAEAASAVARSLESEDPDLCAATEAVLGMLRRPGGGGDGVDFSPRELAVLARLDSADSEIARALELTQSGVRYHVKKILRKLGVSNRREAMREARRLGVAPPPPPPRGRASRANSSE